MTTGQKKSHVSMSINGDRYRATIENRLLLVDFIRDHAGLTGTHVGCASEGICGACSVQINGEAVKSCLMLAVQADGHDITTIEGLTDTKEFLALQNAFTDHDALQCGYCTAGILMNISEFLEKNPNPSEDDIRHALIGNLCRCTGYVQIIKAIQDAAAELRASAKQEQNA